MAFGRTATELVNLLHWSVVGTITALSTGNTAPSTETPPSFIGFQESVISQMSPFPSPMQLTDLFGTVTEGMGW